MAKPTPQKKNKKTRAKVRSSKTSKNEIIAIVLFAFSVLLFFSFIEKVGIVGELLRGFVFALFGKIPAYIILFFICYLAWSLLKGTEKEAFAFKKSILYFLIMLLFSALIHTWLFTKSNLGYFETVRRTAEDWRSGGIFGGGLSLLLQKYMEKAGALVVLIPSTIIVSMILFSLSLKNFVDKVSILGDKIRKKGSKMISRAKAGKESKPKADKQEREPLVRKQEREEEGFLEEIEETKEEEAEIYDSGLSQEDSAYVYPPIELLVNRGGGDEFSEQDNIYTARVAKKLEAIFANFSIDARVIHVSKGPTVTRYDVQPSSGVKVSRIKNLADDIALHLASPGIRIEQIPGKAAIGVEVPNETVKIVSLRDIIETRMFLQHKSKTIFCLGASISGEPMVADIARMPHILIAGATGSGKSVCINSLIISLLYKASPDDVKLILIDPKVVELGVYNGLPHLLVPVVNEPKKAASALNWAVTKMEERYVLFAEKATRDIEGYNNLAEQEGFKKLEKIVIIIDELADLMLVARDTVEEAIIRIAQKARAAGIHLVIATQRPSVDVITGLIKANIPSRIAFKVASQVDSRIVLDNTGGAGADKLLGRGDMLFLPLGSMKATRIQGAFVSESEVEAVVKFIKDNFRVQYDKELIKELEKKQEEILSSANSHDEEDELFQRALEIAVLEEEISVSSLQRKLRIGYNRAGRIVDQMEEKGYITAKDGSNPRKVLIDRIP